MVLIEGIQKQEHINILQNRFRNLEKLRFTKTSFSGSIFGLLSNASKITQVQPGADPTGDHELFEYEFSKDTKGVLDDKEVMVLEVDTLRGENTGCKSFRIIFESLTGPKRFMRLAWINNPDGNFREFSFMYTNPLNNKEDINFDIVKNMELDEDEFKITWKGVNIKLLGSQLKSMPEFVPDGLKAFDLEETEDMIGFKIRNIHESTPIGISLPKTIKIQ